MPLCPACQTPSTPDALLCANCGEVLGRATPQNLAVGTTQELSVVFCPSCGSTNAATFRFCTECGQRLQESVTEELQRRTTAIDAVPVKVARLIHLLPDESHESYRVSSEFVIGRMEGDLSVVGDPFLSKRHASVSRDAAGYLLRDLGSTNGTFVRLRNETPLRAGDEVIVGGQLLRLTLDDGPPANAPARAGDTQMLGFGLGSPRLVRIVSGGREAEAYPLTEERTRIGRDDGEIRFPDDLLLSSLHATVTMKSAPGGAAFSIRDERSRNGVFLRLRSPWTLSPGDVFTAGRQVFRFEISSG